MSGIHRYLWKQNARMSYIILLIILWQQWHQKYLFLMDHNQLLRMKWFSVGHVGLSTRISISTIFLWNHSHHAVHNAGGLRPAKSVNAGESFCGRAGKPNFAKPRDGYMSVLSCGKTFASIQVAEDKAQVATAYVRNNVLNNVITCLPRNLLQFPIQHQGCTQGRRQL